jgi:hypothetical protein
MTYTIPTEGPVAAKSSSRTNFMKLFASERLKMKSNVYESGRSISRSSSLDSAESTEQASATLRNTMLRISTSLAQSARVESMIKRDANERQNHLRLVAVGQRPASIMKQLRYALANMPNAEEIQQSRRVIVCSAVKSLLAVVEIIKRQPSIQLLESFLADCGPSWEVTPAIKKAASSIWSSKAVQEYIKTIDHDSNAAFFLRATERIISDTYEPTLTDIIKAEERPNTAMEFKFAVDDVYVELVNAPQPKIKKLINPYDVAEAFLWTLDLSTYDQYEADCTKSQLQTAIDGFARICSRSSRSKPVVLVMYNTATFRRKIISSPLAAHLTPSGNRKMSSASTLRDFSASKDLILDKCRGTMYPEQTLRFHFAEDDAEDVTTPEFFKKHMAELPYVIWTVNSIEREMGIGSSSRPSSRRRNRGPQTPALFGITPVRSA